MYVLAKYINFLKQKEREQVSSTTNKEAGSVLIDIYIPAGFNPVHISV